MVRKDSKETISQLFPGKEEGGGTFYCLYLGHGSLGSRSGWPSGR
jgi:hypothetical protein